MPDELRISITIPLPDQIYDRSALITKIGAIEMVLSDSLAAITPDAHAVVSHSVVAGRARKGSAKPASHVKATKVA